jgi:hypothetical protein
VFAEAAELAHVPEDVAAEFAQAPIVGLIRHEGIISRRG